MASEVKLKIKGEETVTEATEKAGEAVENFGKRAARAGKGAKKDWAGVGDLFSQFLPRGFQRTIRAFKSTQRQVGRLSRGFKALKGAIAATGIGALVVALGMLVDNWDKIKGAIQGANEETKTAVADSEKLVEASKEQLNNITATESILKLQGKTEEEILMMRMAATDEAITQQRILIQNLKTQKEEETAAATRITNTTKAIIGLTLFPLVAALGIIDTITGALTDLGVIEKGTSLADDALSSVTGLVFDPPEKVAEEADASIAEAEKQLQRLENTRAGYTLRQQKADEQAQAEANRKQEAIDKQRLADEKYVREQLFRLNQEYDVRSLESQDEQAKKRLEQQFNADYLRLIQAGATYDALLALQRKYDMDVAEIDAQAATRISEQQSSLQDQLYEQGLTDYERREMQLMQEYERRIELANGNEELIAQVEADYIAKSEKLTKESEEEKEDIRMQGIDAFANATSGLFKTIGRLSEDNSETQKGLAIADVLLNQAMAMAGAVRGAAETAKDPISLGVLITTMVGGVLSSFVGIKGILDQAGSAGGSVGRGGGATRSSLPDMSATPLPARQDSPDMQAYVVQTQLQGQLAMANQLNAKTTL